MKNNGLQKAINIAGNQSKLAQRLNISPQRVQFWTKNRVPAEWVIPIEIETGVTRHEIRPDIYPPLTITQQPCENNNS
jgi:DNA-binding transcriptional regulator YdaS (Cro superfamily)